MLKSILRKLPLFLANAVIALTLLCLFSWLVRETTKGKLGGGLELAMAAHVRIAGPQLLACSSPLLYRLKGSLFLKYANGTIEITAIKPNGKRQMSGKDFANGMQTEEFNHFYK